MRTASFFTDPGPDRIRIARWAPRGAPAGFAVYRPLNPTAPMLKLDRAEYEPLYQAILARLDPREVVRGPAPVGQPARTGFVVLGTAAVFGNRLVPPADGGRVAGT